MITTVLIILIVVAAVGIIWAVAIPMIKDVSFETPDTQVSIVISQGYTVYDPDEKFAFVHVKRGTDNESVGKLQFYFEIGGSTDTFESSEVPETNGFRVYSFNFSRYNIYGTPNTVSVAPVFSRENKLVVGKITSKVDMPVKKATITPEDDEDSKKNKKSCSTDSECGTGGKCENGICLETITCPERVTCLYTIEDLDNMRNALDGDYLLMNNLDFDNCDHYENCETNKESYTSGAGWLPIGNSSNPFTGTLDGNGKIISNLYIYRQGFGTVAGLFGVIDGPGIIANLGLEEVNVTGSHGVGGLAGYNTQGNITDSYSTGSVVGQNDVGGLVGGNGGNITNSYSAVVLRGLSTSVGGLVGSNNGKIAGSYSTGNAAGVSAVGGLIGFNIGGTATNSYSTGNTTGVSAVGGLVGSNAQGTVKESYATGNVTGSSSVGGLIGLFLPGTVGFSYYDKNTSGQSDVGKGTPKTTESMKQQTTFIGWDFDAIWRINEEADYPKLRWQPE